MKQRHLPYFRDHETIPAPLQEAARIAICQSLKVTAEESVLIITNPDHEVSLIARALYDSVIEAGGRPVLMYQSVKTQLDFAEDMVLAAFTAKPAVVISLSAEKLGKDPQGIAHPYEHGGIHYDHIFHLQMYGEKTCRAFWSPGTTLDSFVRTVPIDYSQLIRQCAKIKEVLDTALEVHITSPGGTNITLGLKGRVAKVDDGDFSRPGSGGNLPAGETFISPENDTATGTIVFDGSISLYEGDILIHRPITCRLEKGYISSIEGGEEARALEETIRLAEQNAYEHERNGKLPAGKGTIYAKNAWALGELGIGLNPMAQISGHMLEDEKAFHTCHFAIGHNYDEDAPALIHLDGLVRYPTIVATLDNGKRVTIEKDGELVEEFR